MTIGIDRVTLAIRRMQEEGGPKSYVTILADANRNYFAQLHSVRGSEKVDGELVSNRWLKAPNLLTPEQVDRIQDFGWRLGEKGFWKTWVARDEAERSAIAREVWTVLVEVYGVPPEGPLAERLYLDPDGSTASG